MRMKDGLLVKLSIVSCVIIIFFIIGLRTFQLNFIKLLGCPVDSLFVILAARFVHFVFVKVVAVGIVETTFNKHVESILVIGSLLHLDLLPAESRLHCALEFFVSNWPFDMISIFVVAASFSVESPLVKIYTLLVIEAAILHDEKSVFVVLPLFSLF